MLLAKRLQGVVDILNASNAELMSPASDATGYIAVPPARLVAAVMELLAHTDTTAVSLDMGCGNGGWMLLAAAAGFPSYGVEINPFLADHCQRNYDLAVAAGYIATDIPCAVIVGDMIPPRFSERYDDFRKTHPGSMPIGAVVEDAYSRLPVSIATADIVYCWAWPTQSRFVYNMLQDEAKESAFFVLPCYESYMTGANASLVKNTLFLGSFTTVEEVTVGRR
jgi:hypothetical protein